MRRANGSYRKLKRSWVCDAATFGNFHNMLVFLIRLMVGTKINIANCEILIEDCSYEKVV